MYGSAEIRASLPPDSQIEVIDDGGSQPILVLRARGVLRFFIAGFLLFWLCGWAAGEGFALWFIAAAMQGLMRTGDASRALPNPGSISGAGLLAVSAFLLLWLALWTFGGIAALVQFLRLLWGNDRLQFAPDRWSWTRAIGPFGVERSVDPRTLTEVLVHRRSGALVYEKGARRWAVTTGGTPRDLEWIVARFWGPLRDLRASSAELPDGWAAVEDAAGFARLRNPVVGKGCGCLLFGALAYNATFITIATKASVLDSREATIAAIPFALAGIALLGAVAAGLLGVFEWRVGHGALVRHWSLLSWSSEKRVAPDSLRIEVSIDSDNDEHFSLSGIAEGKPLRITSAVNDPRDTLRLGRWIAARTGWSLHVAEGIEGSRQSRVASSK